MTPVAPFTRASPTSVRHHVAPIALLLAVEAVIVWLVNAWGDFALIDDWSYLLALRWLTENGRLAFTNWQSSSMIGQLVWTGPFVKLLGFSIDVARLSVTVAAMIGVLGVYALSFEVVRVRWVSAVVALGLATNPLFVLCSHTYLTDVLFCTVTVWAIWFVFVGLRAERTIPTGAWLPWSPQEIYTLRHSHTIDFTSSK